MTKVTAQLTNFRMSPQKVRLVTRTVRGKSVSEAIGMLRFDVRAAAAPLRKLLQSAVANARQNNQISEERLMVEEVTVSGGPVLKRWMPRAQGRATHILKRTATIRVTLVASDDVAESVQKQKKTKATTTVQAVETAATKTAAKKATKVAAKHTITRKAK